MPPAPESARAVRSVTYIGDETTALGYRLAGAHVAPCDPTTLFEVFERACHDSRIVLISAECAARLPASRLQAARDGFEPLVFVLPDTSRGGPPDFSDRVRAELGILP